MAAAMRKLWAAVAPDPLTNATVVMQPNVWVQMMTERLDVSGIHKPAGPRYGQHLASSSASLPILRSYLRREYSVCASCVVPSPWLLDLRC